MENFRDRLEKTFAATAGILYRNRIKTLLVVGLITAAFFTQIPKITIDISTEGFLHANDPILKDYNRFRDQFGRDEFIVLAVSSPDIFTTAFLNRLKTLHDDLSENVPYIDDITSMINARNTRGEDNELIVEDLLKVMPQNNTQAKEIASRVVDNPLYKNMLVSEDLKTTTIVIKTQTYSSMGREDDVLAAFSDSGNVPGMDIGTDFGPAEKKFLTDKENSEVVNSVQQIIKKYQAEDFEISMAGSSAVTHFLKQSMMKDVRRFVVLVLIAVALSLYLMFRRISGVIYPLMIVVVSLLSTIAVMAIFKAPIKLPTQILPSFILAVSVGYSVHILAIFFHQYDQGFTKEEAIEYAIGHSGLAIIMTAATTAGGLLSFSTSEVAPVADLGVFAGAGVLLAMMYTLVLLPPLLALTPIKAGKRKMNPSHKPVMDRILGGIAGIAIKHPHKILLIMLIITVVAVMGAVQLQFSHDILRWLPEDSYVRVGTEKIDKVMRGSITLEVVLDTGEENGLYDVDLLNRLEKTIAYLENLSLGKVFVGKAWSINTILKEINRALNENRKEFYAIPQDKQLVAQELLLFENSGSDDLEDFTDSQFSKIRLMIKVPFEDAVAYNRFIEVVNDYLEKTFPEVDITVTGMTALLFRTMTHAINSMAKSYVYALIIITALMILLIGRWRIGLMSMVPNLFPIIVALGIMHWFDFPLNLFTMLVGNIAIGLAVDDTVHFMHNFRRYYEEKKDAEQAIINTLHTTGRAMLVTSCVLSMGFFIFMFASMYNIFYFGLLTGITIIMALLADYFIAPALMILVHRKTT